MSRLISSSGHCERCNHNGCFTVYQDDETDQVSTFCFSCLKAGGTKKKKRERSLFKVEAPVVFPTKVELPKTFSEYIPAHIRKYLLENNMYGYLAANYKLGYVEYEQVYRPGTNQLITLRDALILPIYGPDGLARYQARSFYPGMPKYINVGKSDILFSIPSKGFGNNCIIVEDILSAIRLHSVTSANTVACTGTHMSDENMLTLLTHSDKIIVWLDGDEPGQKAARKMIQRLHCLKDIVGTDSVVISNVKTNKDPKKLWVREIQTALKGL